MAGLGAGAAPWAADARQHARRIHVRTRRLVDGIFAGQYHSVFKGSGIEFADVREYAPGDACNYPHL